MGMIHGSRLECQKYKQTNKLSLHARRPRIQITLNGLFLTCQGQGVDLDIKVYMEPIHIDQYCHFDSHHPLAHKLEFITMVMMVATNTNPKDKEYIKFVAIQTELLLKPLQGQEKNTG